MIVKYTLITFFKSSYSQINNVIWVRVTENKILIECQDGRRFTYRIRDVMDFEVIHS